MPAISRQQKVAIAVIAGSLILGAWTAKNSIDNHRRDQEVQRLAECTADYAEAAALSSAARSELAAQDRVLDQADRDATQALDEAMAAFLVALTQQKPGGSQAEVQRTFTALVKTQTVVAQTRRSNNDARKRNEATRKLNPVPDPPSTFCG